MKIYKNIMAKTNSAYAYKILKENILQLDMKPGEELKEAEILQALQMSRTPLREAMILLKNEGLLEKIGQKGTFVTKIEKQKFIDGRFLRQLVEEKIFTLACENFPKEYLKKLEENLEQQRYIMEVSRDFREFYELDMEFHRLVFEGVGHGRLFDVATSMFFDYQRTRVLFCAAKIRDYFVFDGHKVLFNLIKEKRKKDVAKVLENHLNRLNDKFDSIVEEYPYYFKEENI